MRFYTLMDCASLRRSQSVPRLGRRSKVNFETAPKPDAIDQAIRSRSRPADGTYPEGGKDLRGILRELRGGTARCATPMTIAMLLHV